LLRLQQKTQKPLIQTNLNYTLLQTLFSGMKPSVISTFASHLPFSKTQPVKPLLFQVAHGSACKRVKAHGANLPALSPPVKRKPPFFTLVRLKPCLFVAFFQQVLG